APAGALGRVLLRDHLPRAPDGTGAGNGPQREAGSARSRRAASVARSAAAAGERSRAVPARARRIPEGAAPARRRTRRRGGGPALPVPRALSLPADAARVCLAPTARLKREADGRTFRSTGTGRQRRSKGPRRRA